jgi:hypothetical protein
MNEIRLDMRVICYECGEEYVVKDVEVDFKGYVKVTVVPCEGCLKKEREEGQEEGYDRRYDDGQEKEE